jgi:hypothetical protein
LSVKNELANIIDSTIAEFLANTEPTAREVADSILENHEGKIREFGWALTVKMFRLMVARRMKKVEAMNGQASEQFELPFGADGVPLAISFQLEGDEEDSVRYISLSRATEWHMTAYEKLLGDSISRDSARLHAIKKTHDALRPIFASHPGITVKDACQYFDTEGAA